MSAKLVSIAVLLWLPALTRAQPAVRCSGPLSEAELTKLKAVPVPRLRQLVASCGIDFEPTGDALGRLRAVEIPDAVLDAVRAATGPAERMRRAEQARWESIKDSQDPTVFDQFLRDHPDSQYIQAARIKLAALKLAAPSPTLATTAAAAKRVNPKDGLIYVWIPPGTFMMGCSPGDAECSDDESPAHKVTITEGFWLGQTPVTLRAYLSVTGRSPRQYKGDNFPAETVTWDEAKAYCAAIAGRLPTEAEWEYAARAGSTGARYGGLDEIAWYAGNSGRTAHEVAQKLSNAFGLFDMLGNVYQWAADWYWDYPSGPQIDPTGAASGQYRVSRGGPWSAGSRSARASNRHYGGIGNPGVLTGIRCVGELNAEQVLWASIKDSQALAAFEDYLRRYPQGQFAAPARQRRLDLRIAGVRVTVEQALWDRRWNDAEGLIRDLLPEASEDETIKGWRQSAAEGRQDDELRRQAPASIRRFRDDFAGKLEPGWQWIDPKGDSIKSLDEREGYLRITVTGFHDLWSHDFNAPRLVREVDGDFTIETKIAGPRRSSGGILVWKDSNNHIRFDRGTHWSSELNLQGTTGGRPWVVARDHAEGDPMWLRLERRGSIFRATYSVDGKEWQPLRRTVVSHRSPAGPNSGPKESDFTFEPSAGTGVEMRIGGTLLAGVSGIVTGGNQTVTDYDYVEITDRAPLRPAQIAPAAMKVGTKVNPKDGLTYVRIPPGTFMMGCSAGDTECDNSEKPAHQVTITSGFWLGRTPVTQQAYQLVTGQNPSHFKGADLPVESVNWDEAMAYCAVIGGRLPTEAEWEYAARAGSTRARYGNLDEIAWHLDNSGGRTHEVAQKLPNALGLYDMLGNVYQWVGDWHLNYPSGSQRDPQGPTSGQSRVVRGSSWGAKPSYARVSNRGWFVPGGRANNSGFRCVAR